MTRQTEPNEANMERICIAGTSLKASRVALGTWAIGGWMWGGSDEADAIRTIHEAIDRGIQWCDARLGAHVSFRYQLRGFELEAAR